MGQNQSAAVHPAIKYAPMNGKTPRTLESHFERERSNVTDISEPMNTAAITLERLLNHMRFFQNTETYDLIFILGIDDIEDVPRARREEWVEVFASGLQDGYIRKTMASKLMSQRQFFGGEIDGTATLSTSTKHIVPLTPNVEEVSTRGEHPVEERSAKSNSTSNPNSERFDRCSIDGSSVTSSKSVFRRPRIPRDCPYCDHTFEQFEDRSGHIEECRKAAELETVAVNQWVDRISMNNFETMRDAIADAMSQFEEKAGHRENVLLLLKRLQSLRTEGRCDNMDCLSSDILSEIEELQNLIVPLNSSKANSLHNDFARKRNYELNDMIDCLQKGLKILKRVANARKSFHIEDLTIGNVISTGSFSTVHLAKCKANGDLYALKVMKRDFLIEQNMVSNFLLSVVCNFRCNLSIFFCV